MKLEGLKKLIKEELKRTLNEVKVKIEYITEDPNDGGPDFSGSTIEQINQDDFNKYKNDLRNNFWKEIAEKDINERIYKIEKVTKLENQSFNESLTPEEEIELDNIEDIIRYKGNSYGTSGSTSMKERYEELKRKRDKTLKK